MFKKIVLITGLLFALVPITNAFAYSGGMLDGKTMQTGANTYTPLGTTTTVTDGNLNTFEDLAGGSGNASVKDHVFYHWTEPQTINYYRLKSDKNNLSIYLYNANKSVIRQIQYPNNTGALTEIKSTTGVYYVAVVSNTGVANTVYEFDVFDSPPSLDNTLYNVANLADKVDGKNVTLTWDNRINPDLNFTGTKVYRDNTLLATLQPDQQEYTDTTTEFTTTYTYKVVSTYENGDSTGSSVTVKTGEDLSKIPPSNVKNLQAKEITHNSALLTWDNSKDDDLKSVNIYDSEGVLLENIPLGNQYKLTNLEISKSYTFSVALVDEDGNISPKETVTFKTTAEPVPEIKGSNLTKEENGDYTYTWDEPTTGQVKILVGENEYKTVPAANGKIVIPSKDMKYNIVGNPDISAVPISESGKTGVVTPPQQVSGVQTKIPFQAKDLLESGVSLLWIVAPFVLLGLSFLLVPKLRRLIVQAFRGKGSKDITGRRTKDLDKNDKEPKELKDKPEKEPKEVILTQKLEKAPRGIRVSERELKEPKIRREKAPKEPRLSRSIREPREGRQRAARAERQPRTPREIRKGR